MSESTPKQNRTPWIIAGVLGCLVVCLLLAVIGVGGYLFMQNSQATPAVKVITATPAPVVSSKASSSVVSSSQPASSSVAPTLPPASTSSLVTPSSASSSVASSTSSTVALSSSSVPAPTKAATGPTGKLAFTIRRGDRPEDNFIWLMNADGTGAKQILDRASEPSFSPDGTQIAYYHWSDGIFVAKSDGTGAKKILGETNSGLLSWSHDGKWIAFSVRPGSSGNIATDAIAPDGTGRHPIVIGWSPFWSPDDALLIFQTCRGVGCGIFKVSSSGGDAVPIITDDGGLAAMSPDGKKIVYQKDVNSVKQLFLMNADGSNSKQLTSGNSVHSSANWSSDGNFIFYRSPEGGQWGIWRMNADGSNPVKLANDMPPGDWPYDRIAVGK